MAKKEKAHIIAYQNGLPKGYVKSVSYSRNTFDLTQNKMEAKGYATASHVQGEIDALTRMGFAYGYTFIYD